MTTSLKSNNTLSGYSSDKYIETYLSPTIKRLEGTKLLRQELDSGYYDVTSMYPFVSDNEQKLIEIDDKCVSMVSISNPLKPFVSPEGSITTLFKEHSVCDLQKYSFDDLPTNFKRIIKKSNFYINNLEPGSYASRVFDVYQTLVERHNIKGITNYSLNQFKCLLEAPGAVLLGNNYKDKYIGFNLYYLSGDDVYLHISCQTEESYVLNCNHQMTHEAILMFKTLGFNRLLLGSVPDGGSEGLKRFKTGYSHYQLPNFICKRIFNQEIYDNLSKGVEDNGFFPLYRSP